jgi:hypothetical protein
LRSAATRVPAIHRAPLAAGHEWDLSWEHFYQGDTTRKRLFSFGFALSPWQTADYVERPSIGKFEGDRFDPRKWRPQTPTTAYMELRDDDALWAAQRVATFTDEIIRAIVHTGEFSDAAAERALGDILIKRRDRVLRTYLPAVNPIVAPRLETNRLTFENAAVAAGVAEAPSPTTPRGPSSITPPARPVLCRRLLAQRPLWKYLADCRRPRTVLLWSTGPRRARRMEPATTDPNVLPSRH